MALFLAFIAGVLVSATASRVGLQLLSSATALAGRSNPDVRTGALIASFALAAGILYLAIGSRHSLERPRPGIRGAASVGGAADSAKGGATARISTPAAGDLCVTSQVLRPAAGTRLALVINREIG
jgi:hypothetical protein